MSFQKILLVDDDEDDRSIMIEAINEIDKRIDCIGLIQGIDALDYLNQNIWSLPDLIFLDLNMPMMDGKEFLKEMKSKEHLKHIPVTIYSTSKQKRDMEETKILGAISFISKPTSFSLLKEEIRRILVPLPEFA
jgi:CheY-like chemotaxis protein